MAAKNGRTDVIQHLLQKGCNINQQSEEGYTVIYAAASRGQTKKIEFLIKHWANLNIPSTSGMTPLLSSLNNGHFDAAQLLIQNKADVNTSAFNENALLLSIQWGKTELAKRIKTNGGKMNFHSMLIALKTGAFITILTKKEKIGLIFSICSLVLLMLYDICIFKAYCLLSFIVMMYHVMKY